MDETNVLESGTVTATESAPEIVEGESLTELFDVAEAIVHEHVVTYGAKQVRHHIKQLSTVESAVTDGKKYSYDRRGRLIPDPGTTEIAMMAETLHACVVRNAGTKAEPQWVPLWTLVQLRGTAPKDFKFDGNGRVTNMRKGILDRADSETKSYIDQLLGLCWEHNPRINPILQAHAADQLGMS